MAGVASAGSSRHVTHTVDADRAIADKGVVRFPETHVVASADLPGEAFVRAPGERVVVAGLRNQAAARMLLAVGVEQHALAALDHRNIELDRVLAGAADAL